MKCVDCDQECEWGELCDGCKLERLRKRLTEEGRIRKSLPAAIDLRLPPSDRE